MDEISSRTKEGTTFLFGIALRYATAKQLVARMGWGLADQALLSITNFAVGVIVARALGVVEFGAFSIAFATYLGAMNASRAVAMQPLLIRYTGVAKVDWQRGTGRATGMVMIVAVVAGMACLVAAWIVGGSLGEALTAIGITLPALLLRDAWRFAFFAAGRGRSAFANDVVLVVVLFPVLVALVLAGRTSLFLATLALGGAAAVAAVAGIFQAGVRPRPQQAGLWWREHRDITARYGGEQAMETVGGQIAFYAIAGIAGLGAVGSLRAAELVLGPLNVLIQGSYLVAIAEAVRLLKRSSRGLLSACLLLSAGLVVATLSWGSIALALPEGIGIGLLGANWSPGRSVLFQAVLTLTGLCGIVGALVGLRALAAAKRSFRARLLSSVTMLICAVAGAGVGGTPGAAWGFVLGNTIGVLIWWWHFAGALREHAAVAATADD